VTEISGKFEVDGVVYPWQRNPSTGGWYIDLVTDTIQLYGEPTREAAIVAMHAYRQGVDHGRRIGRAMLQNEFRNLMACQPK